MAADDVWQAFQPKISNRGSSSNLSQVSNFSLGSQSRLSLSCTLTTWSSRAQLETTKAEASSSKRPLVKSSTPSRAPNSSPMHGTPTSSRKRVTPKRNTPQDGLTQRKIDSYFGSGTKRIATSSIASDVEFIDLTCGDEDDDARDVGRGGSIGHSPQTKEKLASVSRVLFPETSQMSCEKKNISRDKKNLRSNPCQSSHSKDSQKSQEIPADVFKAPQMFKYKVAVAKSVNITTTSARHISSSDSGNENEAGIISNQPCVPAVNPGTSSASSDFIGGEVSVEVSNGKGNLLKKKNVESEHDQNNCFSKNYSEKSTSQMRESQLRTAHESESFDNFTGVTECVSGQSSGDLWTPRHKWGSENTDSDDFERELPAIRRQQSARKKKTFQKVHRKKSKKIVVNNTKKVNASLPCSSADEESHGSSRRVKRDESNENAQEKERDFTLSGGFFPEEDGNEKVPGQAFVIRSPSQECLVGWEDLMENSSITVEHEKNYSDSEKSSILADLTMIDQGFEESVPSMEASSAAIPNESNVNGLGNSVSCSVNPGTKESNPTIPYHSNPACISLSTSEWNDIPYRQAPQGKETPSEDNNKRASSPHEAEVAPWTLGFGIRSRPNAQFIETSPEKAMIDPHPNSQYCSNSSEICNLPVGTVQDELSSCDESPNFDKVEEWISKTSKNKFISNLAEETPSQESLSLPKRALTQHYPISRRSSCLNQKWTRKRCKFCDIKCQVKIFFKSNITMNDSVIKNVKRMKCTKESAPFSKENQKMGGILAVEVQDMTSSEIENEDVLIGSSKPPSHPETQSSAISKSDKRIPIKVQVKYGKWGWEELEIDCVEELSNCSNDNTSNPVFCVQEVIVNICYCSRNMQIDCIISKEKLPRAGFIGQSKYSTSLKNYISHWGPGDNPVILSMVAYSKLFNSTLDDSFCSSIPNSEKDTVIFSSGQFDTQTSADINDIVNSASQSTSDSSTLGRATEGRESNPLDLDSDGQSTPAGLSDNFQEWMTQPNEAEPCKNDAASKWEHLMQRMRSGASSRSSSSSSVSSLSSVTSQGTSADEKVGGRRNYARERKPRICPFYKIVRGTTFAVDAFSYGAVTGITHYFLSHFHYDHYMGLSKKFTHPIYCSSVTAKLVSLKLKVEPSLLKRIDPGQTVKVGESKVTALDANHCPGSVMFLFELSNGKTHLHCGDFRAHPCMESYHALWNVDIDQLYLDTTYCDPTYNFPSQQDIIKDILTIVEEEFENEPKTLIVCGSYTIGKERVFAAIAEKLKAKIWAPYDKFKVLQCVKEGLQDLSSLNVEVEGGAGRELGLVKALSLLTKVKEEAQIHVLPMAYLKKKVLEEHLYTIKGMVFNKVVAFRPTGWAHGRTKGTNLVLNSPEVKIYEAAYSEHSSFSELERFVKFIRPKQVVKTVNVGSPRKRQAMERHINSWLAFAKSNIPIPNKNNESPKSAKVIEEQKRAGFFQPRNLSRNKPSSRAQSLHSSLTIESHEYTQLSTQTSLSQRTQENEISHSSSGFAIKRRVSTSGAPPKRRLI